MVISNDISIIYSSPPCPSALPNNSPPLTMTLFIQQNPDEFETLKTHMASKVEIAHSFYCVTVGCGLYMVVHSCYFSWESLMYSDTWGQMCLPSVGNVTYFKEALLCANIWKESSFLWCPPPHPTPFLVWSYIFQKCLAYEYQAEKAFMWAFRGGKK